MQAPVVTRYALAFVAIFSAAPAPAQLYKWVDAQGVTNYSNQPPADRSTVKNLATVEDRLSVYSPDPGLQKAVDDARQNGQRQSLRNRIDALEDQLEAERRARQEQIAAANARAAAYEKCLAERRSDCNALFGVEPYDPPVVFVRSRPHRPRIAQPNLKPGTIAGHVNADNGIIPGTSGSRGGVAAGSPGTTKPGPGRITPTQRASSQSPRYEPQR